MPKPVDPGRSDEAQSKPQGEGLGPPEQAETKPVEPPIEDAATKPVDPTEDTELDIEPR